MAARAVAGPDGVAVIDKPAGWTSHDVVAKSRGLLGTRKVGHAGTLDPGATGVLVLGIGRATRLLRFVTDSGKTYVGEIVLGSATSTYDDEGDVVGTFDMGAVTLDDVRGAAAELMGEIQQVPPMVSAIKIDGRRLHELARQGIEVDRPPRRVTVTRFDVSSADEPGVFGVVVECSSGTYIRSLAHDVGIALGGGAHLRRLRRTAVGLFTLADAGVLEELTPDALLPMRDAVRDMPSVLVDEATAAFVRHGKVLPLETFGQGVSTVGPFAVLDESGALLAVYEPHRAGTAKPTVVLAG